MHCEQKVRDRYSVITSHRCGRAAKGRVKFRDGRTMTVCGTHAKQAVKYGGKRVPLLYLVSPPETGKRGHANRGADGP